MPTIYTVRADSLLQQAAQIRRDADQSLTSWIILGQSDRYSQAMESARVLESAAREPSIYVRREILRNGGYTVMTPSTATR